MDGDLVGRLAYLALLGTALVSILLLRNRHDLGRMLQHAVIWVLIFLGAVAVVGLWPDIRHTLMPRQHVISETGEVVVPRRSDGHFYLTLDISGELVDFVVDTGATAIVLARDDARRVGIDIDTLDYTGRARTANGVVRTARVELARIGIDRLVDRRVPALINESDMDVSLLGMSYLERFATITISGNELILTR